MRVYEKVRAYLEDKGIKQTAIARKTGIPTATFNAIMTGNRTMYAEDLRAICYALQVSPEKFIEFEPTDGT